MKTNNLKITKQLKNPKLIGMCIAIFWFSIGTYAFTWPTVGCTPGNCNLPLNQDFTNQRVGIATNSPQVTLDVNGGIRVGQLTTWDINSITCDANKLGTIIFDIDQDAVKTCDSNGWTNLTDREPPTWWDFSIPANTDSKNITLNITCPTDEADSNPVEMYIAWDITEIPEWETCASSKNVTLTSWDWNKTIFVVWKDSVGNKTDVMSRNVNLSSDDVIFMTDTANGAQFALYKVSSNFIVNSWRNTGSPWLLHDFCTNLWKAVIQVGTSNTGNCDSYGANRVILSNSSWNSCGNNLSYLTTNIFRNDSGVAVPSGIKIGGLGHYTNDYCTLTSTSQWITAWGVGWLLNGTNNTCSSNINFTTNDYVACGR